MHMLVLQLDADETAELRHEFKIVDTDNSGFIEKNELMEAISKSNHHDGLSPEDAQDIVNQLDLAKNQKINYSEFLTATINVDQYLTDKRRNALFSSIDIDQTG